MTPNLAAPATEQISWLQSGQISALELLEAYIAHQKVADEKINAVTVTDLDSARTAAKSIDARRAKGEDVGPLAGLPMLVKDVYDVKGMPAVSGVPAFVDRDKDCEDAFVVKKIKEAGGVIWGKTNSPFMAGDGQTHNKVYGVTNHPLDVTRSPGGSSGGGAAALATHMTPLEIGSDIGGSIRNPSHFCGTAGLKPTWNLISDKGHVPPAPGEYDGPSDLAVAGPMARNVQDLQLLMNIWAPEVTPAPTDLTDLSQLKAAVWDNEPSFALGQASKTAVASAVSLLKNAGASVETDKPIKDGAHLRRTYLKLLAPIIHGSMPKPILAVLRLIKPFLRWKAGSNTYTAAFMFGHTLQSKREAARVQEDRAALKANCADFFEKYDVLIAPVSPTDALTHNNEGAPYGRLFDVDGEPKPFTHLLDWVSLATACHLPSAVIPVATSANGLPVGVQIIGPEGSDLKILKIAEMLEKAVHAASETRTDQLKSVGAA